MSSTVGPLTAQEALYATRRERIHRLMVALDLDAPNTEDLLGHCEYRHRPMRFVVETKSSRGFGHFLTGAGTRTHAEQVAGANLETGWWPVALYDLDTLGGEPVEAAAADEAAREYATCSSCLARTYRQEECVCDEGGDAEPYDEALERELSRLDDERLPVRFTLARCAVFVVFNSTQER